MTSMFSKLKQFKDLREQGKKMQALVAGESATGTAAGGKVVVTIDGSFSMTGLAIDPELLSPSNKSKVEEGVKDAFKEAMKKIQRILAAKMQENGGFPGMTK